MSYTTGNANSFADLQTALRNACVAAGWTLTGNVLSKGSKHFQTGQSATALSVLGGTGQSGGSVTGAAISACFARAPLNSPSMAFPLTYHIHVLTSPVDEVYCVINWSLTLWAFVAFGASPVSGLPGTGNWYTGSVNIDGGTTDVSIGVGEDGGDNIAYNGRTCPAPFWAKTNAYAGSGGANGYVHHGLDGGSWSAREGTGPTGAAAIAQHNIRELLGFNPSQWNGETVLLPIIVTAARGSGFTSPVVQLQHARYMRNDNLSDGQIITIGTDDWKTYPFYKRSTTTRNGAGDNTGTLGWAIRYDGS